jgi:hypothetical protein
VKLTTFLFFIIICFFSCKKESFTTSPNAILRASEDTLHFDTVFTTTGSVSQYFKIINNNNKGIHINSIKLIGGAGSPFKINADGVAGPQVSNIDVAANDSAYVFVTVSINPNATALPFIVRDSIEIEYNGNKTKVQLEAYGQNAHFFRGRIITSNEVWTNDRPYVILGGLLVDKTAILSITKGCRIYMHADAPLIINGTLKVQGEKWDSTRVVFSSDRLDEPYRDYPAGWPGIIFTAASKDNLIQYATIKNAYQAVAMEEPSVGTAPKLTINESIIDNAYDAGIIAINSSIAARNLLVSNCGRNIILAKGGAYNFMHCTVTTFSSNYIQHKEPVLLVTNYLTQNNVISSNNLSALFRNCIFWGENSGLVENEVVVDKKGTTLFGVTFENVLWRVKAPPPNIIQSSIINDQPPQFDSVNTAKHFYNFRLKDTSPAKNKGVNAGVLLDLDGAPRPVGLPDLGAYENQKL